MPLVKTNSSDDNLYLYQFIDGVFEFLKLEFVKTPPPFKNLELTVFVRNILSNYNQLYVFLYTRNYLCPTPSGV